LLTLLAATCAALAQTAGGCGEVVTVATHSATTTRYTFAPGAAQAAPIALVILIGGGGNMDLDDQGCARQLSRNVLIRMRAPLHAAGVTTALVDAPSDLTTDEGLGGFRITADHADDLGKVIADVRKRTGGAVWIAGHSRGSLSAANAAARLAGPSAPDGVILMSAMMVGDAKARRAWAAHTLYNVDLDAIKSPLLAIGHAADTCVRSPADLMDKITAKSHSVRRQVVTVTGGPIGPGRSPNLAACEVREPHDFVEQEAEVAAGIVRFMRGASY
jgi:hypothetical protein